MQEEIKDKELGKEEQIELLKQIVEMLQDENLQN